MRKSAVFAAFLALGLLLAGCERETAPEPSPSQSAVPSPSAAPVTRGNSPCPMTPRGPGIPMGKRECQHDPGGAFIRGTV